MPNPNPRTDLPTITNLLAKLPRHFDVVEMARKTPSLFVNHAHANLHKITWLELLLIRKVLMDQRDALEEMK